MSAIFAGTAGLVSAITREILLHSPLTVRNPSGSSVVQIYEPERLVDPYPLPPAAATSSAVRQRVAEVTSKGYVMLDFAVPTESFVRVALSEFVALMLVRAVPPADVRSACASAILI